MTLITDFIMNKNMTLEDLIEQLTEIRDTAGDIPVIIPVEIEKDGESLHAYGLPRRVRLNRVENVVEIELKNYFEV